MTSVLLIYPFFLPRPDRSVFRFPPLGVAYLAASLRLSGHSVHLLDCTFLERMEALRQARLVNAEVVGIYSMVSMLEESLWFARELRSQARLLIAGGPLPTCDPERFLRDFDLVVRGEGEGTLQEVLELRARGAGFEGVAGISYRGSSTEPGSSAVIHTAERPAIRHLDALPPPARDLLPNADYIRHTKQKYGHSITTVMSTRGCPFRCEFCSNVVFGGSYRERSPKNVVDEIEAALKLGYERISFADDVFTMRQDRVLAVCQEIRRRSLRFGWECLARADALDYATAVEMKLAGCTRVFFGIESGSDEILRLMNKRITSEQAALAVEAAHRAGLQVGAFFILCYPGDSDDTVLKTLHFATRLPLDYLGLSMPYPLPGTQLYQRTHNQITREWRSDHSRFGGHVVILQGGFSEPKMWFAMLKGRLQFAIRRGLGALAPPVLTLIEGPTDALFRLMK